MIMNRCDAVDVNLFNTEAEIDLYLHDIYGDGLRAFAVLHKDCISDAQIELCIYICCIFFTKSTLNGIPLMTYPTSGRMDYPISVSY